MVSDNEELKREIQEKYIQIELLNKELEQISVQLELMKSKLDELITLKNSINKIQKGEGFSQLGSGIFVSSNITTDNIFLVDVGRRFFVKMNKEEIHKYLEEKINNFKSAIPQISKRKSELQKEAQKQIFELQNLQSNQK